MPKYMDLDGQVEIKAGINEPNKYLKAVQYLVDNPDADNTEVAEACDMTVEQMEALSFLLSHCKIK